MSNEETWSALGEFIVHVIVGAIAFFAIAGVAIAINIFVKYLTSIGIDPILTSALTGLEYVLFGFDILLGLYYFVKTLVAMVKKL